MEEIDEEDPEPLDKQLTITAFVDANWAHDYVTRKSITGLVIFVEKTLVYWKSTRQGSLSRSIYHSLSTSPPSPPSPSYTNANWFFFASSSKTLHASSHFFVFMLGGGNPTSTAI